MEDQRSTQIESDERVEALRHILESKHGRSVSYGEAKEVGVSLVGFYQLLAEDGRSND